jgi:hypothetical protein
MYLPTSQCREIRWASRFSGGQVATVARAPALDNYIARLPCPGQVRDTLITAVGGAGSPARLPPYTVG